MADAGRRAAPTERAGRAGLNPTLTIIANSLRVADGIAARLTG